MDPAVKTILEESEIIFLDMDGVCCDLLKAMHELHKREFKEPSQWDLEAEWGMSRYELWQPTLDAGPDFWINLEEYPWFDSLYRKLSTYAKVIFLTSSTDHVSAYGKVIWLKDRLGEDFQDYILCTRIKHLLAAKNRVLIDDSPKYCNEFKEAGGKALQFKWPWMPDAAVDGALYPIGEHVYTEQRQRHDFC